ncbi:target of rapamycin complex 2 subunit MAPKAP1 isoform X5 [Pelodiscus sinensis]|uniref:target of rapamycin complex 2 subunit MAPKAP1 isoform X5 n=1 Tax=Pelodiscus sinensis TaxID=13735 RepID=UPI0003C4A3BA|nr:target of rapamycin complex 2 subunit MAPKAP1 isoform X4 [Pelodiscus sinensis]|eukprot:XP_025037382.1 target of rapamycin complex 2 subunit MAPKAP1 isoform X4 [Pelodiscus sinensis]
MAFLDNPAIILAHIRQSHVTSDDTGMCEMVLIDHDVDVEKFNPSSMTGDSGSEMQGTNGDTQGYVYSQSVDITSSWDFGIRRRSNTAQRLERLRKERQNQIKCKNVQWKERNASYSDFTFLHLTSSPSLVHEGIKLDLESDLIAAEELSSLFEKKNFRVKCPHSGKQSLLAVRLEQCPLQLNNPFNEYSKFDGKGHVGTTATKKIDVYLPLHTSQDKLLPMTVVTIANAKVHDLIGLICWQYTSEGREPKLNDNVNAYCLHIAEDDGEVDTDFPPLDSNEPIHKFGFSTLALVEKYSSPGLAAKQSLFVRINAAHGFSLIQVDSMKVTMKDILQKALKRRKGSQRGSGSRGEETSEEDPQMDIATVQDMLSSHHYKSFKVSMVHRLRFTTDVQLGISGDKVEIDPVTNQKASTKFWIKQKPISIDSELLCACDLAEEKSPSHAIFKLTYLSNHDYKHLYFESDAATINEIVLKVNYILESRASTARADYFAQKQRKLSRRTSFSFQKEKKSGQQ